MKKMIWLLLLSLPFSPVQAQTKWCGYRDYFRISNKTPVGFFIVSARNTHDLYLQIISERSFQIEDTELCRDGHALIKVADKSDAFRWCVLDVKDGPYMRHPSVSAYCQNMSYHGMQYDGFNSYSYSLSLS